MRPNQRALTLIPVINENKGHQHQVSKRNVHATPSAQDAVLCLTLAKVSNFHFTSNVQFIPVGKITITQGAQVLNPFTYGNPISNPSRFFGRQHEVEQIYSRLCNPEFESTSIVGERRIGKTSFLKYVMHPEVRERYGMGQEKYIFVEVDLQMIGQDSTPTILWQRLLLPRMAQLCQHQEIRQFIERLCNQGAITNINLDLHDLFRLIDDKKQYIVFLLDEFDHVTENQNFTPGFFFGLRSLAIQHHLSLITSSRQDLVELCHSEAVASSPFFNIFANIDLGLFNESEARQLIIQTLKETGIQFLDTEINAILMMAGCHPYFLQTACYDMFAAYDNNRSPDERLRETDKNFRKQVSPHLQEYWTHTKNQEKIVLIVLALLEQRGKTGKHAYNEKQLQKYYLHSEQSLARLERQGLVTTRFEQYTLLNSALRDWIVNEIVNAPDDQKSYKDWLKSSQGIMKQLSNNAKSDMEKILPRIRENYRDLFINWFSDPQNLIAGAELLKNIFLSIR